MSEPIQKQELTVIIRIRGSKETRYEVEETIAKHMHLTRKLHAAVFPKPNMAMIQKCKDFITWGPIGIELLTKLVEKRGEVEKTKVAAVVDGFAKGERPIKLFRLHPPVGGFKKSTKLPFPKGELGKRDAASLEKLLTRML